MKNYYLWIAGAIVLLVLAFSLSKSPSDGDLSKENANGTLTATSSQTVTKTPAKVVSKETPKPETFTNVFPQKGNFKCIYEEVTPSRRTSNTIYFSDGKMRGEFRVLAGASNVMLYDGYYLYTWVEGQSTGSVSIPKSIADFPPIVPKDITEGKVLGSGLNNVSWDCHAWVKNPSLLAKPTYLTF